MKVVYNTCYGGFGLSEKALDILGKEYYYDIPRHDPDLVAVVEMLGEKANSRYASLAIAEVKGPYRIREYDGLEWVETPDNIEWTNAD